MIVWRLFFFLRVMPAPPLPRQLGSLLAVRIDVDDGDADLLLLHGCDLGLRLVLVVDDLPGQGDEGQNQAGERGDEDAT